MASERLISLSEMSLHTEQDDCWIAIDGWVYDVSSFLKKHPGGRWIILDQAGGDATAAFQKTIHSEVAYELMKDLVIGKLSNH